MTYTRIMVHVDLGPDAAECVSLAGSLADRFDADLIGIAARLPDPIVLDGPAEAAAMVDTVTTVQERLQACETVFRAAAGARSRLAWRQSLEKPHRYIVEQSRAADLVIVGRLGPSDLRDEASAVDPGGLALALGRPLFMVPPGVKYTPVRRVVIGWKNTREARRAVADALPLLALAREIYVAAVADDATGAGLDDVVGYLKRHGVEAQPVLRRAPEGRAADELLDLANWHNADLIVIGAYGHSKVREIVFGGVTRDLLRGSPVCCLVAH